MPPAPVEDVNMHEAKSQLSRLVHLVEQGGEVVISRAGTPVARLVPIGAPDKHLGLREGQITIREDFDAPLPDDLRAVFERER